VRFPPPTLLVALCHSQQQAQQVQERLAAWLAPRGLTFNQDKTTVVHLDDGLDFLGFGVRRYRGKLLIKPSKAAIRRVKKRLAEEMRRLRGSNVQAVLATVVPIVRGWSAFYRGVVSKQVFTSLDDHMWRLTYKWATYTHPNKPRSWVIARYYGRFHPARHDRWKFKSLHRCRWRSGSGSSSAFLRCSRNDLTASINAASGV